jgi:murein DD-endopeptidase MepM/ murein hydrolase activator NlpD
LNGFGYEKKRSGRFRNILIIILVPFLLLLFSYVVYQIFIVPSPEIVGVEGFRMLPAEKEISFSVSNARNVEVLLSQGIKVTSLVKEPQDVQEKTYSLTVKPKDLGFNEGKAKIIIKAEGGWFRKAEASVDVIIDTVPPKLGLIRAPSFLSQGMAGLVLLKASGADSVYVKLDQTVFRGYPAGEDQEERMLEYIVMIPAPFDVPQKAAYYAVAEDTAGNRVIRTLPTVVKKGRFRSSRIRISNDFLRRVIVPLKNMDPEGDLITAFIEVNEKWRLRDAGRLSEISADSEAKKLWAGRFLQLRNSKVMARYGDRREYIFDGRSVSRSVHLGYDLASVSHARVEAANAGIVKFAGELGIYGNTVIVDHGLGLMSLYGHLSEFLVKEGDKVKKGDIIARTGSTGLAGGDHLHFGIIVNGIEVSPIYWWDGKWLKRNIEDYL